MDDVMKIVYIVALNEGFDKFLVSTIPLSPAAMRMMGSCNPSGRVFSRARDYIAELIREGDDG